MSKRLLAPPRARSATATAALCGEQRGGWRGKAPPGSEGAGGAAKLLEERPDQHP